MKRFGWNYNSQKIKRLGLLLSAGLFMVACNRNAAATPTAIPPLATIAPTITATAAVVATATATTAVGPLPVPTAALPGEGTIFASPNYTYTVTLPCCWLALPTAGTAIKSALAEAEAQMPVWGDLNERVQAGSTGAVMELIALLLDKEDGTMPVAQMTVSVLPAKGLTLDSYLLATQAELAGIADTTVLNATIDDKLGAGGFPASLIKYTAAPVNTTDTQTIAGLQVAFYGYAPDTLMVLTFTTTTERLPDLEEVFLSIVRSVTFNDSAL